MERGWAINLGGGFHHCCATEGGGFCAYADITLSIQFAFSELSISRYFSTFMIGRRILYTAIGLLMLKYDSLEDPDI